MGHTTVGPKRFGSVTTGVVRHDKPLPINSYTIVALLWVAIDILNTHNRDHLNPSEPIDDRGLVHTHVARRDPADKLVIQLAEASTLEVPRQTTPARRRREILLPEGIRPERDGAISSNYSVAPLSWGIDLIWIPERMPCPK